MPNAARLGAYWTRRNATPTFSFYGTHTLTDKDRLLTLTGNGNLTLTGSHTDVTVLLLARGYDGSASTTGSMSGKTGAGGNGGKWLYVDNTTLPNGLYAVSIGTTGGSPAVVGSYTTADGVNGGTGGAAVTPSGTENVNGKPGTGGSQHTLGSTVISHSGGGGSGASCFHTRYKSQTGGSGVNGGGNGGNASSANSTVYANDGDPGENGGGGGGGANMRGGSSYRLTASGGSGGAGCIYLYRDDGWIEGLLPNTWQLNSTIDISSLSTDTSVNFKCAGTEYIGFNKRLSSSKYQFRYRVRSSTYVTAATSTNGYTDLTVTSQYRVISFESAPTGDLLTWLQSNAERLN